MKPFRNLVTITEFKKGTILLGVTDAEYASENTYCDRLGLCLLQNKLCRITSPAPFVAATQKLHRFVGNGVLCLFPISKSRKTAKNF